MANYNIGSGGHYESISAWYYGAPAAEGDILEFISNVDDPWNTEQDNITMYNTTWNMNGYTLSFNNIPITEQPFKFRFGAEGVTWTINNGTINSVGGTFVLVPYTTPVHYANLVLNNVNIACSGESAAIQPLTLPSHHAGLTANDSVIEISNTANLNTSHILINRSTSTANLRIDNCIFRNTAKAIFTTGLSDNIIITNTDFINCGSSHIDMDGGGKSTISGCTFYTDLNFGEGLNNALSARASTIGINSRCAYGVDCNAYWGYNIFNVNGKHAILFGSEADEDQGTGGLIEGNTWIPDFTTFGITVRSSDAIIQKNNFLGSLDHLNHTCMVGVDAGHDLRSPNRAQRIIVRENNFLNSAMTGADQASWSYHNIVIQADNPQIYNNNFFFDLDVDFIASPNLTFIYPKGTSGCQIYNNTMHSTSKKFRCFRLTTEDSAPGGSASVSSLTIANNWITGDYQTYLFLDDGNQEVGLSITNNLMGISGSNNGTYFDMSTSAWFTNNIQDSDTWKMRWGGTIAVTGDPKSAQGFAPIGQYLGTPPDPIISGDIPDWESAVSAYANINYVGLSGVTLNRLIKGQSYVSATSMVESRQNLADLPTSAANILTITNVIG
jgi:hypothetical protein